MYPYIIENGALKYNVLDALQLKEKYLISSISLNWGKVLDYSSNSLSKGFGEGNSGTLSKKTLAYLKIN